MQVEPFQADDLVEMMECINDHQVVEIAEAINSNMEMFVQLEHGGLGMSYTVRGDDGSLWACGGVFTIWPGRAAGWAFVADMELALSEKLSLVRFARRVLGIYPAARIEATVLCSNYRNLKTALALGFKVEAERMRKYDANGRDFALLALVR